MSRNIRPTGVETFFDKDEVIVSKTNTKGVITYANRTFLKISEYSEPDVIGRPHNLIRHPHMPRCIFKLLWETLQAGNEMFAYIVNLSRRGNHYWVLAHVTPSFDAERRIVGFHSNRRVPDRGPLENVIIPLYRSLREHEERAADPKSGVQASSGVFQAFLQEKGMRYDQFIFSL